MSIPVRLPNATAKYSAENIDNIFSSLWLWLNRDSVARDALLSEIRAALGSLTLRVAVLESQVEAFMSGIETTNELMSQALIELKLLNLHAHELPRALNDGYAYGEDDISFRNDLSNANNTEN